MEKSQTTKAPAAKKPAAKRAPARKPAPALHYVVSLPTGETVTLADRASADRLALYLAGRKTR